METKITIGWFYETPDIKRTPIFPGVQYIVQIWDTFLSFIMFIGQFSHKRKCRVRLLIFIFSGQKTKAMMPTSRKKKHNSLTLSVLYTSF